MPFLRNARVPQREKFMNGTTSLWRWLWWCVFICVFMCVSGPNGIKWRCNIIIKYTISPILTSCLLPSVLQAFFEHCHLLEGPLLLMLSLLKHGWMCMRDTVQCQGGLCLDLSQAFCSPDEKLRKRLNFRDILSSLGIWLLYAACTWAVCVSVQVHRCKAYLMQSVLNNGTQGTLRRGLRVNLKFLI